LTLKRANDQLIDPISEPIRTGHGCNSGTDYFLEDDFSIGPLTGIDFTVAPSTDQLLLPVVVHIEGG
jgi:hypothetical protein